MQPARIIDTHTHFYDPTRPQGVPWPAKTEAQLYRRVLPEEFRRLAAPLGVTGTVVIEASPWLEDNQWLLDLARDEPVIVGVIGHLNPGTPEFREHLRRFAANPRFRGIRLGGAALANRAPAFLDDLRRMSDAGLTLDAIGGPAIFGDVLRIAGRLPGLRVVIDHLPFAAPPPPELAAHPQVFAKVSGARPGGSREALDQVWEVFGADRVVYGSDWPVSARAAPYARILTTVREYFSAHGPLAMEKYFWKNSVEAYRCF